MFLLLKYHAKPLAAEVRGNLVKAVERARKGKQEKTLEAIKKLFGANSLRSFSARKHTELFKALCHGFTEHTQM